ncbi:MAG: hypothetical protein Q7R39_18465 [Dehalococcoidia bacterium]|nr:hypothetical protein [Dehalococcoidia bacterium]
MPTHRGGQETPHDRLQMKSLLKVVEERLLARGIRTSEVEKLLAPAEQLLPDGLFWTHTSDGLAMFISPTLFRYYRVPLSFEESVTISNRFHIRALLPLLSGEGRFYLLALGQNQVRFFESTHFRITELKSNAIPKNLAEALQYDDMEKQLQFHTGTAATTGGKRSAMFHGHGAGAELDKEYLREFFGRINAGLHEMLKDKRDPLLLAGVEYLFPIYAEANSYPYLLDEGVAGNPEEQSPQELLKHAWPIAQRYFLREQEDRLSQYEQLVGIGRSSNDVQEIVPAACAGRVDCLFVGLDGGIPGRFDPVSCRVDLGSGPDGFQEDLLDFAAVQTILHGGTVYPLESKRLPGGASLAAVFRY